MRLRAEDPQGGQGQAVKAGATEVVPVAEAYGWRLGRVLDPFGRHWEITRPVP
jgi:PhnB protein